MGVIVGLGAVVWVGVTVGVETGVGNGVSVGRGVGMGVSVERAAGVDGSWPARAEAGESARFVCVYVEYLLTFPQAVLYWDRTH